MKYLVLGSSGQIGTPLCKYLKSQGNEVYTYDIEDDEIDQDLRLPYKLFGFISCYKPDFIFFLAFDVGGSRYLKIYQDTTEFLNNNVKIMLHTFRALEMTKVPFIFASSQMSNMSHSSYGILKALGEHYTKILGGLTVKFWNVYGIETDLDKAHVITDFILKAKENRMIDMITDGNETRQFLHADDCSRGLYSLSGNYYALDKTNDYHITSFEWTSVYDIAKIIADFYPGTIIQRGSIKDEVQKNVINVPSNFILNYWKPEISIADGIKLIIQYYEGDK